MGTQWDRLTFHAAWPGAALKRSRRTTRQRAKSADHRSACLVRNLLMLDDDAEDENADDDDDDDPADSLLNGGRRTTR